MSEETIDVRINGVDALSLLGMMQLVLRHPKIEGRPAEFARAFAQELEQKITRAAPGFKDLCAMGWDKKKDGTLTRDAIERAWKKD